MIDAGFGGWVICVTRISKDDCKEGPSLPTARPSVRSLIARARDAVSLRDLRVCLRSISLLLIVGAC